VSAFFSCAASTPPLCRGSSFFAEQKDMESVTANQTATEQEERSVFKQYTTTNYVVQHQQLITT
jgi:hypothetical protein